MGNDPKMNSQEKEKPIRRRRLHHGKAANNINKTKAGGNNTNNKNDEMPSGDIKAFYKHPLINGSEITNSNITMATSRDEVPGDLKAFFGHPLVNGEDTQASALALLHEYQNLPAIDRNDVRISEKFDSLSDILRQEAQHKAASSCDAEYSVLLNSDVDAFLNKSNGSLASATKELEASPQDLSKSESSNLSSPDTLIIGSAEETEQARSIEASPKGAFHMYDRENSPSTTLPLLRSPLSSPSKIVNEGAILDNLPTFSPSSVNRIADVKKVTDKESAKSHVSSGLTSDSLHSSLSQCGSDNEQIVPNSSDIVSNRNNVVSNSNVESVQSKKKKGRTRSILAEALMCGEYSSQSIYEKTNYNNQKYHETQEEINNSTSTTTNNNENNNQKCHEMQKEINYSTTTANNNNRMKKATSKPSIPPPPPYSSSSSFPFQGINIPPISAICQQIQKEHPQIAGVPLAMIEKSLLSLGFPPNSEGAVQRNTNEIGEKNIRGILQESQKHGMTSEAALAQALTNQISLLAASHMPCQSLSGSFNEAMDMSQGSTRNSSQSVAITSATKTVPTVVATQSAASFPASADATEDTINRKHGTCNNDYQPMPNNDYSRYHPSSKPVTPISNNLTSYTQYNQMLLPTTANNTHLEPLPSLPKCNTTYPQFPFSTLEQLNIAPTPPSKPLQNEQKSVPHQSTNNSKELNEHDDKYKTEGSSTITPPFQPHVSPIPDASQLLTHLLQGAIIPPPGNGPVSHVIVPKSLFNMATQRMGIPVSYASPTSGNPATIAGVTSAYPANMTTGTDSNINPGEFSSLVSKPPTTYVPKPPDSLSNINQSSASFPTLTSHLLGQSIIEQRLQNQNAESFVKDYSTMAKTNNTSSNLEDPSSSLKRPNFLPVVSSSVSTVTPIKNSPMCTPDSVHADQNQSFYNENHTKYSQNNNSNSGRQSAPLFQQQLSVSCFDMYKNSTCNTTQPHFIPAQKSSLSEPNTPVYQPNMNWHLPPQNLNKELPAVSSNSNFCSVSNVTSGYTMPSLSAVSSNSSVISSVYQPKENNPSDPIQTITELDTVKPQKRKRPKLTATKKNKSAKTPVSEHPSSFNLGPLSIMTTNITPTPSPGIPVSTTVQSPIPNFRHPLYFSDSVLKEKSLPLSHGNEVPSSGASHPFFSQISPITSYPSTKSSLGHLPLSVYDPHHSVNGNDSKTRTPSPAAVDKSSSSTNKVIDADKTKLAHHSTSTVKGDDKTVSDNDINDLFKQTMHSNHQSHNHSLTPVSKGAAAEMIERYGTLNTSIETHKGQDSEANYSFTSSVESNDTNTSHYYNSSEHNQSVHASHMDNHSFQINNQTMKDLNENRSYQSTISRNRSQYEMDNKPVDSIAKDKPLGQKDSTRCQSNVLVIKPQGGPSTPPPMQHHHLGYHNELKSPDSGFNESCVSPSDGNLHHTHSDFSQDGRSVASGDVLMRDRILKRRRSANYARPLQSNIPAGFPERRPSQPFSIPKLDPSRCFYRCFLDTPISASQKIDEDKITYLNKGQYYNLIIEYKAKNRPLPCSSVKSMVIVTFRDEKCVQDELRAWQFWHSRQHTVKQRIIDIDQKSSSGVSQADEISHNAVTFTWKPQQQKAELSITINCLSTDFSNQKGVKGLPLHVQVDTFENESDPIPVHRAYCQIKVFCDKGAERKARDEERKKEAKTKQQENSRSKKKAEEVLHPPCDISDFYDMVDLVKQPVLFTPVPEVEETPVPTTKMPYQEMKLIQPAPLPMASPVSLPPPVYVPCLEEVEPVIPAKRQRTLSQETKPNEKVLLYVRERHEAVFTALLLLTPTMFGLVQAVEEKYGIPAVKIRNIYKRSHKGILVKMDDNIIRHYSNEATFIITINRVETPGDHGDYYNITLMEIDSA